MTSNSYKMLMVRFYTSGVIFDKKSAVLRIFTI